MSMFQCGCCGCAENTALTGGHLLFLHKHYDFAGAEERQGLRLCSACTPSKFAGGEDSGYGEWHGQFKRVFLPKGLFETDRQGNLAHVETGDTDYHKYAIEGA